MRFGLDVSDFGRGLQGGGGGVLARPVQQGQHVMTNGEKRERKKLMEQLDAQRQELESAGAHDAQELISSLIGVLSDPSVLVRAHARIHRTPARTHPRTDSFPALECGCHSTP